MPVPKGSADGVEFFSYNAGPVHVVTLASFYAGGFGAGSPMTVWLDADLTAVNRSFTPWVVVVLHAPWYNSNTAHTNDGQTMRRAYEATFIQHGVNAVFSGHVHAYERSHPVDNLAVVPAGQGIIHVTVGDGGAGLYKSWLAEPAWSAYRSATFGHAEVNFMNKTHGLLEVGGASAVCAVVDARPARGGWCKRGGGSRSGRVRDDIPSSSCCCSGTATTRTRP